MTRRRPGGVARFRRVCRLRSERPWRGDGLDSRPRAGV